MRRVLIWTLVIVVIVVAAGYSAAVPYVRATSLFVRSANLGGRVEAFADSRARVVDVEEPHLVPTRQGEVTAQFYRPRGSVRRAVLLVPGVHSFGVREPRLMALAKDLAGSGVAVMTMGLPDLMGYQITAR